MFAWSASSRRLGKSKASASLLSDCVVQSSESAGAPGVWDTGVVPFVTHSFSRLMKLAELVVGESVEQRFRRAVISGAAVVSYCHE